MTPRDAPVGPVTEALVRAGWLPLEDRLMRGLSHDLHGRAAALGGLVRLLEMDPELDVGSHLVEEVAKLEASAACLRSLLGDPDGDAQPLAVGDLLPSVVRLHERERGAEGGCVQVTVRPGAPPILVNWTAFSRVLLLLLSGLRAEGPPGGEIELVADEGPDGNLEVQVARGEPDPADLYTEARRPNAGGYFEPGLEEALAVMGGRMSRRENGTRILRFPALAAARRAGTEESSDRR